MRPPLSLSDIARARALEQRKQLIRLFVRILLHCSAVISTTGAWSMIPALLTSTSTPLHRPGHRKPFIHFFAAETSAVNAGRFLSGLRMDSATRLSRCPDGGRPRPRASAFLSEKKADSFSNPRSASRDNSNFPGQTEIHNPPLLSRRRTGALGKGLRSHRSYPRPSSRSETPQPFPERQFSPRSTPALVRRSPRLYWNRRPGLVLFSPMRGKSKE